MLIDNGLVTSHQELADDAGVGLTTVRHTIRKTIKIGIVL